MNKPQVALSIRQPWAWLILNAGKDAENRSWPTLFRGPFYIHAAKGMTRYEYDSAKLFTQATLGNDISFPRMQELNRGGIVGHARIVDCVSKCDSPWFQGPRGFLLGDAGLLPFTPLRGQLGFFKVDPAIFQP